MTSQQALELIQNSDSDVLDAFWRRRNVITTKMGLRVTYQIFNTGNVVEMVKELQEVITELSKLFGKPKKVSFNKKVFDDQALSLYDTMYKVFTNIRIICEVPPIHLYF